MKAVIIDSFGHEDHLKLAQVKDPEPGPSEVLVEIAYTSVNPVDWKIRKGMLKEVSPHRFPLILGFDAAGTIRSVGSEVTRFRPGERVYAYCRKPVIQSGTYAEFIALDQGAVARMPSNLGFREAGGIPLVGLTAWQALYDAAKVKPGETALIHAGSGGVGGMGIQLAKAAGARVLTTASRRNWDYVRGLGADAAIDYHDENIVDAVRRHAPEGVDVVLDTVGGCELKQSCETLKKGGRLVSVIDEPDPEVCSRFGIQGLHVFASPDGAELERISRLIEEGKVRPLHTEELPLEQVAEAQLRSEEGHIRGKLVLKIK